MPRKRFVRRQRRKKAEVSLKIRNERLYTVIEVRDNGCGMAKHQIKKYLNHLFSKIQFQLGMGGFYYVREIVKSHLGFMRVDSTEEGSCFYIYCQNTNNCTLNFSYRSDKEWILDRT